MQGAAYRDTIAQSSLQQTSTISSSSCNMNHQPPAGTPILNLALTENDPLEVGFSFARPRFPGLFSVCRQLRIESVPIYFGTNILII